MLVLATLVHASASAVVLTETFETEVFHPTRSAFVLFYAPWYGPLLSPTHRDTRLHPARIPRPRDATALTRSRLTGAATARR